MTIAAFLSRKVGKHFAESKWIAISLYNIIIVGSVFVFLNYYVGLKNPDEKLIATSGSGLLALFIIVTCIFGSKAYMVYNDKNNVFYIYIIYIICFLI